ncbi:lysophospholipid acyltransferase family protein [Sandaracinobacteroides saxicola]|uniref:1-acyl-sn-glycerol-3-phosphate acyltransferase n=1 Tax=Sandaracinobacteroides saxicola TaxID=2759707 RepID=A0A7G5IJP8_9SPHN|nr:lysophospholipid acyltransferase family protein [Sandaracinobacteroides saxicola]QMW23590.1 1-acyl-sn-glycerol-3-phosphate acyltransferase [Sandaracinobacteroides saxicola]
MATLRGLLFALLFYLGSVPIVVTTALLSPFSRAAMMHGSHLWSAWCFWLARWILGIRLVVRGTIPGGGHIVAMKHQSFYDALLTLYLFKAPVVVLKAELLRIPVFGYVVRKHGSIAVQRGKHGVALRELLRAALERGGPDRPVLIFPEGTRVPVGEAPKLKSGLSALYGALELPIVPMAVDAGRVWPKGIAKYPGTVTAAFGPPVPPGLSRAEMEAAVHAAINADPRTAPV